MSVLDQLKARRRHQVTLRSGLLVGYHYPDLNECILKIGQIPLADFNPNGDVTEEAAARFITEQPQAVEAGLAYTRAVVAAMLDDIDGEVLEGVDPEEVVRLLEPEDRQELFLIGTRQRDPETGKAL